MFLILLSIISGVTAKLEVITESSSMNIMHGAAMDEYFQRSQENANSVQPKVASPKVL